MRKLQLPVTEFPHYTCVVQSGGGGGAGLAAIVTCPCSSVEMGGQHMKRLWLYRRGPFISNILLPHGGL